MAALLDLHPALGHPAAVAAGVHAALDETDLSGMLPGDHGPAIAELARARTRLRALELKLVAAAEKAAEPRRSGAPSTGAWLARQTRRAPAEAARDARLAQDLDRGLPATGAALDAGRLSVAHARVIAHTITQLPDGLSRDQVAAVELSLVEQASRLDPTALRRAARRALAAVEPDQSEVDTHEDDQLRDEEALALARTRLTLHDNDDGTTTGHFTVPTLAAAFLKKVLDAMTAPRRGRLGATRAQAGDQAVDRDPAHDRGLAFATLLEHLPTDHLHGKVAATVVVTLDLDTLSGQLTAAGLDTGDLVSSGTARRLACNAGLIPAVLGGASLPLDLGRSRRLFTEAHRVAGATVHTSCAADGCDIPYAWTELHHRQPWSTGGRTDLDQMVPLCGFHHRRIHDHSYLHRRMPDGSIRFARRT